jgi:hypothetical protein
MAAQHEEGFLDGKEGKSSKRLLSVLGWAAALAISIVGLAFAKLDTTLVLGLVGLFLTFSAGMQGVSVWQEKKK